MDNADDDQSLFEMLEEVDDLEGLFSEEPAVGSLIVSDLAGGSRNQSGTNDPPTDDEDEKQDLELLQGLLSRLKKIKEPPSMDGIPQVELTSRWKNMNEEDSLKYLLGEIDGALLHATKMKNRLVEFEQQLIAKADEILTHGNDDCTDVGANSSMGLRGHYAWSMEKFVKAFDKPYFKTPTGFDSPKVPRVENYLPCDPDSLPQTLFNENELVCLHSAVMDSFKSRLELEAAFKKDSRLISVLNLEDTEELSKLLTSERQSQLDWDDISSRMLNMSSPECKRTWNLYLRPEVNKDDWSEEENKKLMVLAEKYKYQNWDDIALELDTSRSGYQCFVYYHSTLNKEKIGPWTDFENECFSKVVSMSSFGDHVVWPKVAYYMESRGVNQLSKKYKLLHKKRRKGEFSLKEDEFLMRNMEKIRTVGASKCLEKNIERDNVQVSSRVRDHLKKSLTCRYNEWSEEEDRLLLRLYNRFGDAPDCFSIIAKHFKTRNRSQIRHRYNRLKSIFDRDPNLDLSKLRRHKLSVGDERRKKILKLAHELEFSCGESTEEENDENKESDESNSDECDEGDEDIMNFFRKDHFPLNVKLKTSELDSHLSLMEKALCFVCNNNSQLSEFSSKNVKPLPESDYIYDKILKGILRSRIFPLKRAIHDQPSTSFSPPSSTLEPLFPDLPSMEALAHLYEKIERNNKAVSDIQRNVARVCSNSELSEWFAVCEIIFTWPILLSLLNKKQEEELTTKINHYK